MEEAAWLVRAHSEGSARGFGSMTYNDDRLTGTRGAGEPDGAHAGAGPEAADNESGELLATCDSCIRDSFHEEAIGQAGCGLSQARVVFACALAVGGAALELASVPFILPSAEIELCILPHEKNWLVLISLVGCALGATSWGALADRLGRRRALMSALAVNAVFASVAAFMPTYGTFMMARFCSALGSGGLLPAGGALAHEASVRAARPRSAAGLAAGAGAGALVAAALAGAMLPQTGALTLIEDKEHFSAWHRYLLVCTLPILASLVLLIWTQESPRYLLEVGREVDAMTAYQSIHSGNQFRLCGKEAAATNNRAPGYHLGELTLPSKRSNPHRKHGMQMFCVMLFHLFSCDQRRQTLSFGGVLLFTMAIQFYLSSYVPGTVVFTSNQLFEASKQTVENVSIYNEHLNTTIENVHYYNVTFTNCTFRDMLISHVTFENCSFYDAAFFNIKTSYTMFEGCLLVNSTIIDTDLELGRELDADCVLVGTVLRGLRAACARRADLTSRLQPTRAEQTYVSQAMLIAAVLALLPQKLRPLVFQCGLCVLLCPALYIARGETALYIVEASYRVLLTLIFFTVVANVLEKFPARYRCMALGLMLTVGYSGGALVWGLGSGGATASCLLAGALAGGATLLALKAF